MDEIIILEGKKDVDVLLYELRLEQNGTKKKNMSLKNVVKDIRNKLDQEEKRLNEPLSAKESKTKVIQKEKER